MLPLFVLATLAVYGGALENTREICWTDRSWTIGNAEYIPVQHHNNVFIHVRCTVPGYYPSPRNLVRCIGDYTEASLPRCVKSDSDCPRMSSPVYGSMTCNSHPPRVGTTCWFKCSKGYLLQGSKNRTCQGHYWTGSSSKCQPNVRCLSGSNLANGNVLGCSNPPFAGEVCTYNCHPGYKLEGSRRLRCSTSAQMTYLRGQRISFLPYCIPLQTHDGCQNNNGGCSHICKQEYYQTRHRCECPPGWTLGNDQRTCVDVDECNTGIHHCHHKCINTTPGYRCSCDDGYVLIDQHHCVATRTSNEGGEEDGPTCHVSNGGCAHRCSPHAADGAAAVTCSCRPGFELAEDGKGCLDIDECTLNNFGCSHVCQNVEGSAKCSCPNGYRLSRDEKTCLDIDECASPQLNKCEHECHNTNGSYACSCKEGYLLFEEFNCQACRLHSYWSAAGSSCEECPPHSYTLSEGRTSLSDCLCRPGFTGDPGRNEPCTDVNECLDNNFGCSNDCLNSVGSAMCTCPKGFELEGDLKTCRDVNECDVNNGGCQNTCHNVEGDFYCSCPKGYILSNTYFCTDINECEDSNGNCSDICINVPGGYHCSCRPGYYLDRGGEDCRALSCPKFAVPKHAKVECFRKDGRKINSGKGERMEEDIPPDTMCKAVCRKGYTATNSRSGSIVACDEHANWNATIALVCEELHCPPLSLQDPVMQFHPPDCSQKPMAVHSECRISCPPDYRLRGKARFTCHKSLQWKPDTLTACVPVSPLLSCSKDTTWTLQDFNDTWVSAVVPRPRTNLLYRVKHQPDWVAVGTPTRFPLGTTKVTFTIHEPRLDLRMTCDVVISVIDSIAPVFDYCPESLQIEGERNSNGVQVNWKEPVARDNVAIHSIFKTLEPNATLTPGVHSVKYIAKDAAGNEAECSFEINVLASSSRCGELADPPHGEANCMELLSGAFCDPVCDENYRWSREPREPYTCDATGRWSPSTTIPPCVPECEEGAIWSEVKQLCEFHYIDLGRDPE